LLISLDKFLCKDGPDIPFFSINSREQILTFLDHQYSQKELNGLSENRMLREGISRVSIKTNGYFPYFLDGCSIVIATINPKKNGKRPLS